MSASTISTRTWGLLMLASGVMLAALSLLADRVIGMQTSHASAPFYLSTIQLPDGYSRPRVRIVQPVGRPAHSNLVETVMISLRGADGRDGIIFDAFTTDATAAETFEHLGGRTETTLDATATLDSLGPAKCYTATTARAHGATVCVVRLGHVLVWGVSVRTDNAAHGRSLDAAALARTGVAHLQWIRGHQ